MSLRSAESALAVVVLLGAAFVNCGGSDSATGNAGAGGDAGTRTPGQAGSETSTGTGGSSGGGAGSGTIDPSGGGEGPTDLGRPYANVTAVVATPTSGGYTFDVSVESADLDCSQYANWWEVLSQSGALLYRRILEHSHTDENGTSDPDAPGNTFTRSGGPVDTTADEVVLVRAHISTEGYNGTVMRGSVAQGFAEAPDIDGTFAADVESEDPQPAGCLF
ncbi:MAG: hypothetical protein JW940_16390 [Polyangiaceae bacterium]|nr:hypothetical protein [Polyangiaceae bacterium]